MNNNGLYIKKGSELKLISEDTGMNRVLTVEEEMGRGGSSICYRAVSGNKMGRLKVFQTKNSLDAYRMLDNLRKEDVKYEIINNYIPYYEILCEKEGREDNGFFLWLPDGIKGITLERYIKDSIVDIELYRDGINNGKALREILRITMAIAECTAAFHSVGLWYLDLKPSNLMIPFRYETEINPGRVSLFDLETVARAGIYDSLLRVSPGYSAPELYQGKGDNRSDIYSIGAILYTMLVSYEDYKMMAYDGTLYNNIEEIIKNNKFIDALESARKDKVRKEIAEELKKCLICNPNKRYDSCEDLARSVVLTIHYLEAS